MNPNIKPVLDDAAKLIDADSGGMKLMELLPAILVIHRNIDPDDLIDGLKCDSRFKVFEYYWRLDDNTLRLKYFVTLTYK
jgi:hypothetical protein